MDIQLKQISKCFVGKQLFSDLNLTFLEGQMNCLMGPSGSGKTTILNMLMGLTLPEAGIITGLEGRKLSVVFQEDRLIEHWDALRNIRLVCGKEITQDAILRELAAVGIDESISKPVRDYSGGMKRRVAIVRAMLAQSDLVILDEPFKGLDIERKKVVMDYVRNKTRGKTVILVTHDPEEAKELGAKVVMLG